MKSQTPYPLKEDLKASLPVGKADGELFSSSSSSPSPSSSSATLDVFALASFLLTSSKFSTKSGTSSSSSSSSPPTISTKEILFDTFLAQYVFRFITISNHELF